MTLAATQESKDALQIHLDLSRIIENLEDENTRLRGELTTVDDLFRQSRAKLEDVQNENTRLREAIEWALLCREMYATDYKDELRARAFPPQFETVEVKRWLVEANNSDGAFVESDPSLVPDFINRGWRVVELTGTYQRPIPAKTKHRAEISRSNIINDTEYPQQTKFFREWEE